MKSFKQQVLVLSLCVLMFLQDAVAETAAQQAVKGLNDEWSEVFFQLPVDQQGEKLKPMQPRAQMLIERYPDTAEPLVMKALVLCSLAAVEGGLGALSRVAEAKDLIIRSIRLDPFSMEGSAYIILGNLYYRLPGWPISFGDDELARVNLETAIRLYPAALDSNFYYGDFLLEQGEFGKALIYLERADKAPIRPESRLSDLKLKDELRQSLKDAREKNTDRSNFFSQLLTRMTRNTGE